MRFIDQDTLRTAAWLGWPLALYSTFSNSVIPAFARSVILSGVSPSLLLLIRLVLSVVLLIGTMLLIDKRKLLIDKRGLWLVSVTGLISGVEICVFFLSLAYLDASMAAMLKSTQPLMVLLILRLGGEALTRRHFVRIGLAMGGIYLLVGPSGVVSVTGVVLIAISVVLYALQLVFTQWYLHSYDSTTVTTYLLSWMTLVTFGWWLLDGATWQQPNTQSWLIIIFLAVFSTYLARIALYSAVTRIGSGQVSLLWPLQMFLAVIVSVIFLQEYLTSWQWIGGLLILLSALLAIERIGNIRVFR
ncbi:MAG: DMT family transporter [Chloroflexota bacterium]